MDANEAVKVVREGRELKVTLYRKGDPEWTTHVLTELEADRFGLIFAAMAGYNPQEAIALWERMEKASSGQTPPEFMSTHPSEGRRIEQLKKYMPEALARYKPAGK